MSSAEKDLQPSFFRLYTSGEVDKIKNPTVVSSKFYNREPNKRQKDREMACNCLKIDCLSRYVVYIGILHPRVVRNNTLNAV